MQFGEDGIYGPDIRARCEHRSSLDVFEARGGKSPRKRPNPQVTEIHAGSVIEGDGWKLTVGHAQHVQPYLECLAFRLDTKEGSICYTGDSGPSSSIAEHAKGCDLLIEIQQVFDGTVIWGEDLMKLGMVNAKVTTIETRPAAV